MGTLNYDLCFDIILCPQTIREKKNKKYRHFTKRKKRWALVSLRTPKHKPISYCFKFKGSDKSLYSENDSG